MNDLKKAILFLLLKAEKDLGEEVAYKLLDETVLPIFKFKLDLKMMMEDIESFKKLFTEVIIPQSRQFYLDSLGSDEIELDEQYIEDKENEILQLAYVGLFHKIENYENRVLVRFNQISKTNHKRLKKIGIDFDKKILFNDRNRIRLICNCIKHNDAYPKNELLQYYPEMDTKAKISNSHLNFEEDISLIILYVNHYNLLILLKLTESFLNEFEAADFPDIRTNVTKLIEELSKDESYKDPQLENIYLKRYE